MKSSGLSRVILTLISFAIMSCLPAFEALAQNSPPKDSNSEHWVVVTFFTSSDCPFCENVKELLEDLKTRFPIRTDVFDINQPDGYDLFSKVGAAHKDKSFAVPLVIVGNEVMIGQSEIYGGIEKTIRLCQTSKESVPLIKELTLDASLRHTSEKIGRKKVVSGTRPNDPEVSGQQEAANSPKIKIINDKPD
jgi:glutaredoxin